jgi:hypothetical protein
MWLDGSTGYLDQLTMHLQGSNEWCAIAYAGGMTSNGNAFDLADEPCEVAGFD